MKPSTRPGMGFLGRKRKARKPPKIQYPQGGRNRLSAIVTPACQTTPPQSVGGR